MKDRSDDSAYEGLSGYEDEGGALVEALVVAPPATKKQAAPRSAARPAGKRSRRWQKHLGAHHLTITDR